MHAVKFDKIIAPWVTAALAVLISTSNARAQTTPQLCLWQHKDRKRAHH